ncbi:MULTISPECIES: hypothetical protein [unclassified Streptomyces]|uniref:hypothetical protein n=1 Tax=unclassified Streptomyces TaxID=2593676 RepID=UPI002E2C588E|nr:MULTISPECIES: hypothetical protein [unclassified Streptomyces]
MAQDPAPKHLTITLDFDLQTPNSTVGEARIKAAYNAAVDAALEAATKEFPEGSVKTITAEMHWSYRWMEKREVRFSRDDAQS